MRKLFEVAELVELGHALLYFSGAHRVNAMFDVPVPDEADKQAYAHWAAYMAESPAPDPG